MSCDRELVCGWNYNRFVIDRSSTLPIAHVFLVDVELLEILVG